MAKNEILEQVLESKLFYRVHYRRALQWLVYLLFVILVLVLATLFVFFSQPASSYYATSNVGGVRPLTALEAPNMSDTPLIE